MPRRELLVLLCAGALCSAGCGSQQIVRASPPPSVSAPTVEENPQPPQAPAPPVAAAAPEPAPEPATPPPQATPAVPAKRPAARPRPAQQPETSEAAAAPAAPPKPAAPVISPELSANDLAVAQRNTTANLGEAQKNLQATNGKHLNAAQNDLVAKVQGFISQAQDAIRDEDWVRAANLADKARVLSIELVKGL